MSQCGASQLLYCGNVVDVNQTMAQLGATEGARFTTQSTWIGGNSKWWLLTVFVLNEPMIERFGL